MLLDNCYSITHNLVLGAGFEVIMQPSPESLPTAWKMCYVCGEQGMM